MTNLILASPRAQALLPTLLLAGAIARAARADAEVDECSDGRLREIVEILRGGPSLLERRRRWPGLFDNEVTRIDVWAAALGAMRRRLDAGHFQTWQLNFLDEVDVLYVERRPPAPEVAALDPIERRRHHALLYLYAAWASRQGPAQARVPWLRLAARLERATTQEEVRAIEAAVTALHAASWAPPDAGAAALDAAGRRQAMIVRASGDDAATRIAHVLRGGER